MPLRPSVLLSLAAVLTGLTVAASPVVAYTFPPITEAEKALTEVTGSPGAPAVVLFRKGDMDIMDFPDDVSSRLEVVVRIKVLTDEGKDLASLAIDHSELTRLSGFTARTVLPDGRTIPLAEGDIFQEVSSSRSKAFRTKATFPAVEVGAILDYRYVLNWDSVFYLDPWYFHDQVPTVLSEIVYHKPNSLAFKPWARQTDRGGIQTTAEREPDGQRIRAWMENLRAMPDEPYAPAFAGISSAIMVVPKETISNGIRIALLDTWRDTCQLMETYIYNEARRKSRKAKKKARELVAGVSGSRAKAATLHRFVRDDVDTLVSGWVGTASASVDDVLDAGRGTTADKALLLQTMLDAVKIDAALVWAADRDEGTIDVEVANPGWFNNVLVTFELDGARLFLDVGDPRLGFGRLAPHNTGMPAVIHDKRKPEVIQLPEIAPAAHGRRAELHLAVGEDGALGGRGTLEVTGHFAWSHFGFGDDEATREGWRAWLESSFPGFTFEQIEVDADLDGQRIEVRWTQAQTPDAVLGDEVSLALSRPIGPVEQPFVLPPQQRLLPVQFRFEGSRNEVTVHLTWPAGWQIDVEPEAVSHETTGGTLATRITTDPDARTLTYHRSLARDGRWFAGREAYAALRDLFDRAARHDAQDLVLVRE